MDWKIQCKSHKGKLRWSQLLGNSKQEREVQARQNIDKVVNKKGMKALHTGMTSSVIH